MKFEQKTKCSEETSQVNNWGEDFQTEGKTSKYKGIEVGAYVICSRNNKEPSEAL